MVGQHDAACRKLRVLMPGRFLPFARPCKSIVLVGPNSTLYPFETAPASVWYCVADVYIATDPACSAQAGKNSPLWQPLRTKQQKPPSLQPGWAERRARRRKHRLRAVLRSQCGFFTAGAMALSTKRRPSGARRAACSAGRVRRGPPGYYADSILEFLPERN